MKNKIFFLLIFFSLSLNTSAQLKNYQFIQLDSLQLQNKKPVLVILHTDWCQYCSAMINAAKTNKGIYEILNKDFYLILMDAEDKNTIKFNGKSYSYKPNGLKNGFNELADELTKDRGGLVFPNIILLDDKKNVIFNYPSYLAPKDFIKLLSEIKTELNKLKKAVLVW